MPLRLSPGGGTCGRAALDAVDVSRHVRQTPRSYRTRLPRKDPKSNRFLNNNISRRSEREWRDMQVYFLPKPPKSDWQFEIEVGRLPLRRQLQRRVVKHAQCGEAAALLRLLREHRRVKLNRAYGHYGFHDRLTRTGKKKRGKGGPKLTPLSWAALNGHADCARMLLDGVPEDDFPGVFLFSQSTVVGAGDGGSAILPPRLQRLASFGKPSPSMASSIGGGGGGGAQGGGGSRTLGGYGGRGGVRGGGVEVQDIEAEIERIQLIDAEMVDTTFYQGFAQQFSKEEALRLLYRKRDEIMNEAKSLSCIYPSTWASTNMTSTSSLVEGGIFGQPRVPKADIEATDPEGRTALMFAVYAGHADVVAVLLERGADILRGDKCYRNSLKYAAQSNRLGIERMLKNEIEARKRAERERKLEEEQQLRDYYAKIMKQRKRPSTATGGTRRSTTRTARPLRKLFDGRPSTASWGRRTSAARLQQQRVEGGGGAATTF